MDNLLKDKLFNNYPKLFTLKDDWKSFIGLGCMDGWYEIIDNLCKKIQSLVDSENLEQPMVLQIKEKFAGLRFYITSGDKRVYTLIEGAEHLASKTCEKCGEHGEYRKDLYWKKTLCNKCYSSWERECI